MKIINTQITDVKLLEPQVYKDDRGYFLETFRDDWFKQHIAKISFLQENHSHSVQGTLRGLHYQSAQPQGKLIRVTSGEIYDVVVDLRHSSPTFGQWVGTYLSEFNHRQLWVPEGFAHGFYVISKSADCHYKCTDYYAPEFENSLVWNDHTLNIDWPLIANMPPKLSPKDLAASKFQTGVAGRYYE
ncbi:dTDP-4-dehydrorhamnose 3,5-epimerase [Shewanella eurypsychrophilus]|uniref:dTDP-4-dehydrorhamnose 3,5-epimerase n=1 Tax=Shewanella eurypsychrophilus TaxID=2593656 RepID=A0ABX6V282_9GAMM|nr:MULTISPECIES: dTDP-4-dehydrorhamnose 3,5-epimerase [Shewanella]QFU20514.1 dTDP-4-dehydrorhamnose 3,5-epimerase [Shewanella sp. YLB-09]QFU20795.1 dTDP-4-dehydrorhamnose 3,5-epimerase [Shewanella sp. YLB-09]QPG56089.1 dTDP-4-dehydrorhamnose 3,5-epimerase [Shewanella eurypsychrophilus]